MTVPYRLEPISKTLGCFVSGIDLNKDISSDVITKIKNDLVKHRLLIFKKQGKMSAENQIKISNWWGKIHSTFYKHPKSPHPDIFRVSNDEREGCVGVGTTGWHIDGTFAEKPFKVQTMHFWSVCKGGKTLFSPMRELVESLTGEKRKEWERLYFVARGSYVVHPLIYPHPDTKNPTMLFHNGRPFVQTYARDYTYETGKAESTFSKSEISKFRGELSKRLQANAVGYEWELGDFAVIDNLAIAHFASPGTQRRRNEVGLRILHRTTVAGSNRPMKGNAVKKEEKLDI